MSVVACLQAWFRYIPSVTGGARGVGDMVGTLVVVGR